MSSKILDLRFPLNGLDRSVGYQTQPPYSTVDALNVRPRDCFEDRLRGGSRPGTTKSYPTDLSDSINMMSSVSWVTSNYWQSYIDNFNGDSLGSNWEAISGSSEPSVGDDASTVTGVSSGDVLEDAPSGIDTSKTYTIGIYIAPYSGQFWGRYSVYFATATNPASDGCEARVVLEDDTGSGTVYLYSNSTLIASGTITGTSSEAGWLEVSLNGTTATVNWRGTSVTSGTVTLGGTKVGFGLQCYDAGGVCVAETFRVRYYHTTQSQAKRNLLICGAGGTLYKEDFGGVLSAITSASTIETDRVVNAQERLQKLYIADWGDMNVQGEDGTVTSGVLTATSVSDWTTYGISTDDCVVNLYNSTGLDGTYKISSVVASGVTLDGTTGSSATAFKIQRGPKVYDPKEDTLELWMADTGAVPQGCECIALYRDRIVLGGGIDSPHLWYMSKQADPNDWDYGQTDAGRAIAGQNSDAGLIGEPITAIIAHSDDYLLFGCENSLWILRGDPAFGGMIDSLSHKIGIVGSNAWCKGPNGETIFLSKNGLYMLEPSSQGYPRPLSTNRLPKELKDLSSTSVVTLNYDLTADGVHILVKNDAGDTSWWFDWETKGLWPVSLPYSILCGYEYYSLDDEKSKVLFGCDDGYVRNFDDNVSDDDGTAMESYVEYGPFNIGGGVYYDGLVQEVIGELDEQSGDVEWSIHVGRTPERASTNDAFVTGTWSSGLNYKARPKARGGAMVLKVAGSDGSKWAMERVTMVVKQAGEQRRL